MSTFWILWELTIPLTILAIGLYFVFCVYMFRTLANGMFRKCFKQANIFIKIGLVCLFILYIPMYFIMLLIGKYE